MRHDLPASPTFAAEALAQRARVERARNALWRAPDTTLDDLARALGYADPSHLTREFSALTGRSPVHFAAEAVAARARVAVR